MSEAVSALGGAVFDGFCRVEEIGPTGMITLRGDLGSAAVKRAVKAAVGANIPAKLRIDGNAAWMSPDELLLFCDYATAEASVAKAAKSLGKAHSLVANVSDARAHFRVTGSAMRDVLAKLTPVDVAPRSFTQGDIRRSRLAQVPAAFWMTESDTVEIVCFRSVARYVFDILKEAAAYGSEVA